MLILCFIIFLTTKSLTDESPKVLKTKSFNIIPNSTIDQTQKIQKLIILAEKEQKTLEFSQGTYLISKPLVIKHPLNIRGENALIKLSSNFKSNKLGQGFFTQIPLMIYPFRTLNLMVIKIFLLRIHAIILFYGLKILPI